MKRHTSIVLSSALTLIITFIVAANDAPPQQNDWTEPFPAFRIAGNLYYVGSKGLASYLVTTPEGHILINSDLEANVPMIRASMESLGFKFSDIKILLISHAHWDHCAAKFKAGNATAFIDLAGYKSFVDDREQAFRNRVEKAEGCYLAG